MAFPSRVLAAGNSPLSSISICGDVGNTLTAAGSSATDALQLSAVMNTITTSSASTGVLLPKCEAAGQVAEVLAQLPTAAARATVLPLIETARGLLAVQAIAAAPSVARLAFGSLDYMADLDLPAHSVAPEVPP